MIVLAGLLILVAGALLVGGLGNGETTMLWGSVGVSAAAAVVLVLSTVRRNRAARADDDDEPALVAASAAAGSSTSSTPTAPSVARGDEEPAEPARPAAPAPAAPPAVAEPSTAGQPSITGQSSITGERPGTAEAETVVTPAVVGTAAPVAAAEPAVPEPGVAEPAVPEPVVPAAVQAPPAVPGPSTGSHAPRTSAGLDEDGEPVEEDVEVTDLLLVLDLTDEVEVVDEHPRYHLAGCSVTVGQDVFGLPLPEAKQDGFTACGVCRPDRNLADAERRRRAAAKA